MIEQYKLHESIGQGEYGKVYRATNTVSGQIVALKTTEITKFHQTPKLLELCMQEIDVLQKMDSPYIVKFIELIKTPTQYCFIYEYCSGGPLDKLLLLQGHFTEQKSLKILYQLIEAFKSMREHSIIHRDLKPSNILIHDGIYKLADFGFCKPIQNDVTATMLGSPIYMAPEVLRGLQYSSKADIWSLGAVLYELLVGKCPFEEKSIAKLITAQDESDWVVPPQFHFTRQTQNLLKSMLVKDPQQRCTWEYLFQLPLNSEGKFIDELGVYQKKVAEKLNILQDVVNERCKIQFICQASNLVLEQQLNEKSNQAGFKLLQLGNQRGQHLINVIRNYMNCEEIREYPSLNKLRDNLRLANEQRYFVNNFEYSRLIETISKEMELIQQGITEFKSLLEIEENFNIVSYIKQIRAQNYLNFIDQDKDKSYVLHCVQILDALNVDQLMNKNIDPTLDPYLEIKSMTKNQLIDRFDQLQ